MLRRVLARAIPLSSASYGFPKPLSPLLRIGGPRLATSSGDPIAYGGIGGEDDPFSFPDHYHKQLPPDAARGVDAVVAAAEATGSNAADAARALDGCGAEASEPLVVAALGHRRERRLVDAPLARSMSWPWRGGGHRHGRAGAEVDGERDGGDHEEDR